MNQPVNLARMEAGEGPPVLPAPRSLWLGPQSRHGGAGSRRQVSDRVTGSPQSRNVPLGRPDDLRCDGSRPRCRHPGGWSRSGTDCRPQHGRQGCHGARPPATRPRGADRHRRHCTGTIHAQPACTVLRAMRALDLDSISNRAEADRLLIPKRFPNGTCAAFSSRTFSAQMQGRFRWRLNLPASRRGTWMTFSAFRRISGTAPISGPGHCPDAARCRHMWTLQVLLCYE